MEAALAECRTVLLRAVNEAALLESVAWTLVTRGRCRVAWIGGPVSAQVKCLAFAHDSAVDACADPTGWALDDAREGLAAQALGAEQTARLPDLAADTTDSRWHRRMMQAGARSGIALALTVRRETIGVLCLYSPDADAFGDGRQAALEELASDIARALDARRECESRRQVDAQLTFQTHYDAVTGLPNRTFYMDRVVHALRRAERSRKRVAVMKLAVDPPADVAAQWGAGAEEIVLRTIAQRLREASRPGDLVARLDADQFGIEVTGIDEDEELARFARQLLVRVMQPVALASGEMRPHARLGVSVHPRDGSDISQHLQNASHALSTTDTHGGHLCNFYSADANARVQAQFDLFNALTGALERREFVLHYQPKVSLATGQIVGAEALLRWNHPTLGALAPRQFIRLAEECGVLDTLGEWVIEEVCRQLGRWQRAGLPACPIAVNLPLRQVTQENLLLAIARALQESGVPPTLLELELNESALVQDLGASLAALSALKNQGILCSLDDLGTGQALMVMKHLPLDRVKIDQSFVRDIATEPDSAAICDAVIGLAHKLAMKVVAKGVESEAQVNSLRRRGCDEIQGYYFSPPLPADECAALLRRRDGVPVADTIHPAQESPRTLLMVDDEPNILHSLRRLMRGEGYEILTANSAHEALEILARQEVQVILSDQRMPNMDGTEFLARVRTLHPNTTRLVLSGYAELSTVIESVNRGTVFRFLTKPWTDDCLREHVREAFRYHENQRTGVQDA
ncbi:EAL domain-containing protein [Tahibacter amnicola]|uniref:EAL domain-containing protein n=1 Tax=Tahibacter amnicola TaxID=2976241 RepID=A0ABY6BKE1_9GAMM|nr:EAL domain-containing protein [Tahibacter amnicola]UXI69868.1 EAL domain-containing protein [Tahibacter amnicola]